MIVRLWPGKPGRFEFPHPMQRTRGRPAKHPFALMAVGDSIFIAGRDTASLKGCVHHMKPERRFRFKKLVFRGAEGVRVWRIA